MMASDVLSSAAEVNWSSRCKAAGAAIEGEPLALDGKHGRVARERDGAPWTPWPSCIAQHRTQRTFVNESREVSCDLRQDIVCATFACSPQMHFHQRKCRLPPSYSDYLDRDHARRRWLKSSHQRAWPIVLGQSAKFLHLLNLNARTLRQRLSGAQKGAARAVIARLLHQAFELIVTRSSVAKTESRETRTSGRRSDDLKR